MSKPRVIAFYLPQFHPIPENDEWWGKGFTEWTNVGKAKKLFPGHYQPRVPADLGYYDLRVPEVREKQAELAKEAGIYGFCYWHYWFGNGKRLLERPFNEVLQSGKPDFPFCLAWANESWHKKMWKDGEDDTLLIEQQYLGEADYTKHFYDVLAALKDTRYIRIDNKPVFVIYKPFASKEIPVFIKVWRKLAKENGLDDIFFVGHCSGDIKHIDKYLELDFNAINTLTIHEIFQRRPFTIKVINFIFRKLLHTPNIKKYSKAMKYFFSDDIDVKKNIFPTIFSGWDHTPRSGSKGTVLTDMTVELFGKHVNDVLSKQTSGIIFLKSWNEWAEGNYMEPDTKYGKQLIHELNHQISIFYS